MLAFLCLAVAAVLCAASVNSTEIAPGVMMPFINLGASRPSNVTLWLEVGGTGIDTALTYGEEVQNSVRDAVSNSSLPRHQIFVTTKIPCCPPVVPLPFCDVAHDPATDIQTDLTQLGVDYVDLMLLHWPCATMEETVAAYKEMEMMVARGTARAIGVSNFNASELSSLVAQTTVLPAINQCGFSIGNHRNSSLGQDFGTVERCRELGVTYSAYSPLGGLSGVDVLKDPDVIAIGKKYGKGPAQVALRWVVQQGIVAVTASDKITHDEQDLDVFEFALTDSEMALLATK